jgi:maltokinase
MPDLATAIRAAGWPALLPMHRAEGDDQPVGVPTLVDAQPLGDGLVLVVVADEGHRTYPVPLAVGEARVRRALPGEGASEALVALMNAPDGTVAGFEVTTWHHDLATGERGISVDQTNESVILGDRAVVKWTFLADEGPHPAPAMLDELDRSAFAGMPRPWGALQWRPPDGSASRLLALVVGYVPGAVDGWTWAVDDVRRAVAGSEEDHAEAGARAVGQLVADFHRALAHTARPATHTEATAWRTGALADLDRALEVTRGDAHLLLARHADAVRATFDSIPAGATPVMRVHGDLHVGQVLRHHTAHRRDPSYVVTDFDGNPVVPAAQRLAPQPAALDVAGMAQSFVHAGLVVRKHNPALDQGAVRRTAELARAAFVDAYRQRLGEQADLLDIRLLLPFSLRQVCREFTYAATHLPRWSYVPEAALPMLLGKDQV